MRKVLHFIILGVALGGVRVLHFPKVCQNEMYFYTAFFSMKKVLPDWAEIAPHACQLVSGLGYMAYFFFQTNCFSWYSSRQRTVATIPVKLITHTEVRHWLSSHTELACARPKRWRDGDCAFVKWRNIYRWMLTLSCAHQNGSQLDLAYCIWKQVFRRQDNNVKIRCFFTKDRNKNQFAVHCQGLKKNYMIQTIFFFLWHSPFCN